MDFNLRIVKVCAFCKEEFIARKISSWEELTRKPYLTVSEAYLVLNVRVETLRRWMKEGIVKTNRVGKKHLISREILVNSRE